MRVSQLVTRHSRLVLVLAALLVLPSIIGIRGTVVEYNILSYLPRDISSMQGELIIDRDFGDASSAFLIVENKTTHELLLLKEAIASVDGVKDVVGLYDIVSPDIPVEFLPSAIRESFLSERGSLLIVRFIGPSGSERTRTATLKVRSILDEDSYLSSAAAVSLDVQDIVNREIPIYLGLAVVLVTVILGLIMGSWLIPIIFLAEIGLAVVYNLGTNGFLGKISFLSQSMSAILQIGGTMDFSIFLLYRYEEERERCDDRIEAMARAIDKTMVALIGSAVTDIGGYMALCAMKLGLGFDIGIIMSKGAIIGFLVVLTILPALILSLDGPIHEYRHKPLAFGFKKFPGFVSKHSIALSLAPFLLIIPSFYGYTHAIQDYNLSGGLPDAMPSTRADRKLKADFHMLTTHFVIVREDLPPMEVRDMIAGLSKVKGVSGVVALEKYVGALIPEGFLPESVESLFKHDGKEIMLITSIYSVSMPEEGEQLDKITRIVQTYDREGLVTGEGSLQKDLVAIAAEDLKRVDIISMGANFLIVLGIFISISIPFLLVGAIELAIFMNLGLSFYLGQSISFISGIVIGCVQLGCTIDYSILLVSRFKEELQGGRDRSGAMREALGKSASSILTSSLILSSATAAMALVTSLSLLKSLCLLIARGAILSMAVVFFLLPALLIRCEKLIAATSVKWPHAARHRAPPRGIFKDTGHK